MNPLLKNFDTAPFSQISVEDFKPAFHKAIENAKHEIDQIISNDKAQALGEAADTEVGNVASSNI